MPASREKGSPWWESLTIDILVKVIENSILHPFVAALIPLCLRAVETPYSAPIFKNTVYWAIFVCILHILGPLNARLAYGKPRAVDADEEVVVITGGASGLGRCLAEIYALKGMDVAVLDIQEESQAKPSDGIVYFQCDVADAQAVRAAWAEITKQLGAPTILINNAGIVHGKRLENLTMEEVERIFRVNTTSHYLTTKLFLPPLLNKPNGGTIVTISSVLAKLGASQLSAYSASKAALVAFHHSVTAELSSHPQIKTILVTPGQLGTEMFSTVSISRIARFFSPIVEVQDLAIPLVKMIEEGRGGLLALPFFANWISLMDILPISLQLTLRKLAGVDTAMKTFRNAGLGQVHEDSIVFVEKGDGMSRS